MLINTGGEEKITKLSKMGGGNRSILLISSLNNGVKCRKSVYIYDMYFKVMVGRWLSGYFI